MRGKAPVSVLKGHIAPVNKHVFAGDGSGVAKMRLVVDLIRRLGKRILRVDLYDYDRKFLSRYLPLFYLTNVSVV